MARKPKTHVRNPRKGREALCGRESVTFAGKGEEFTCKACAIKVADGTLEKLEFAAAKGPKSDNSRGQPRLTPMQKAFAAHPQVTTNAKQAAIEVGYSESFAKSHALALRKQLAPLIMEHQEKAKKISAISVAKVQTELAAMGFANVIDYFDISESGRMMPKKLNELTREQAAAIQEVKLVEYETLDEDGDLIKEFRIGWLKLADKRANLVELGKTLGMFNKITIEDKREEKLLMNDIPTDALEDAEKLLLDAVTAARAQKGKNNAVEGEFERVTDQSEK